MVIAFFFQIQPNSRSNKCSQPSGNPQRPRGEPHTGIQSLDLKLAPTELQVQL